MSYDSTAPELEALGVLLAEASRNVTFVVGAGLSMPAGLPGWTKLNEALAGEAYSVLEHDATIAVAERERRIAELETITDPWILGDELQRAIPRDRYVGGVRRQLTSAAPPPDTYSAIWRLNPSGIVNFNLDHLAEEALSGTAEQVSTSLEESKYLRFLLLNRPFLFQPHGRLERRTV